MVENPLPIVEAWSKEGRNCRRASVHAEMKRPLGAVLDAIHERDLEAGIAMTPETPLREVHAFAPRIQSLTVMGVHPGASGQAFLGASVLANLRLAAEHFPDLPLEIDGGVTKDLLEVLIQAGAMRVCAASAVFFAPGPPEA